MSKPKPKKHQCPVCGFPGLEVAPRSESGGGSYEICPSCGFQFGVSDDDEGFSEAEWREQWVLDGMPWCSKGQQPPARWNPRRQLTRAGLKVD